MIADGRRSPIPDDLDSNELGAIRIIAFKVNCHILKARLFDVLWVCGKNHNDAKEAAENYLDSVTELDNDQTWNDARDAHFRALTLAGMMGRNKPLFQKAINGLLATIRRRACDESFRLQHFMQVYVDFRGGDDFEVATLAEIVAQRAESASDWDRARAYWEVAVALYHKNKRQDDSGRCAKKAAWTHIREAEQRVGGGHPSFMVAAEFQVRGIEALRREGEDKTLIEPLKSKLTEYQLQIGKEMSEHEMSQDITPYVRAVEAHVAGHDLRTAMLRFAFGTKLSNPGDLRRRVEESAKNHPLIHLFGASVMDDAGRVVLRRKGLLSVSPSEYDDELEQEMFSQAAQIDWSLRAQGYIEPARFKILSEHFPSLGDLAFIVKDNPFVPEGHELIFLKGIHAGMHGDFMVASHLLVPQLENSIRQIMMTHGVDVRNLEGDGTQPLKILGPLLGMTEAKSIFGESLLFELRGALLEKSGFNFRNQLAHGFVDVASCHSSPGVNLWWLTIRLCLFPIMAFMVQHGQLARGELMVKAIDDTLEGESNAENPEE